ncbi:MAG TPA: hypothetical protein DCL41_00450 [Bdellovibrionales bacterium]|nr:hypothetical protein [Pseudobdellovibrionaceae bacterium]HAG90306.1 hypothetical protein [Bdellovibrionales bacterium]|tara:strand:- start:1827 stop:2183 length:357 start_codon:yes stop_codon:yes gene_type:complete
MYFLRVFILALIFNSAFTTAFAGEANQSSFSPNKCKEYIKDNYLKINRCGGNQTYDECMQEGSQCHIDLQTCVSYDDYQSVLCFVEQLWPSSSCVQLVHLRGNCSVHNNTTLILNNLE